jgi:hypothetical protein
VPGYKVGRRKKKAASVLEEKRQIRMYGCFMNEKAYDMVKWVSEKE